MPASSPDPGLSPAVRRFLDARRVGHLATADAGGAPHVIPVCYARVEDAAYVVIDDKPKTTTRLRRVRNIEANPRAALIVDHYDDDWSRLGWVLLRGPAAILRAGDEHARALKALRARYPPYRAMSLGERPVIRLAIEQVTAWGALD